MKPLKYYITTHYIIYIGTHKRKQTKTKSYNVQHYTTHNTQQAQIYY